MLELVFVIVIAGILAAMIIPRLDRDNMFEAANQLLNHIKYTQHLAMTEDVYNDTNVNWFQDRWGIDLYNCGGYSVYSDKNRDGIADQNESAIDPQSKNVLQTTNACVENAGSFEKVVLSNHYNIVSITSNNPGGCVFVGTDAIIKFDNLGRPYSANAINGVMKLNCEITLTGASGATEIIRIHPETGYACMLDVAGVNCI